MIVLFDAVMPIEIVVYTYRERAIMHCLGIAGTRSFYIS
jgi:hypothetical protein